MIKKIILLKIIFLFFVAFGTYTPYIPHGQLISVKTKTPITTEHLEEGAILYFISPADVWVLENKAISKGDIFKGYVSMLKMPVKGVNAALKVEITDLIRVDGTVDEIKGRIIFGSSDTLGGNLTNPLSYNKMYHTKKVYGAIWGGTYQYVPSGEYEFGRHMIVNMKDSLYVQFDEDYYF